MKQDKIIIKLQEMKDEIIYLREDFDEHKESMKPMFEIYKTSKNLGRFLLWAGGIITAVVGALLALREYFK
ncbi:MAG: hypothetical protein GWP19_02650 [Planctomycetia bacterium]|nr:hypothetical protein [Planctomycetia bacterium]